LILNKSILPYEKTVGKKTLFFLPENPDEIMETI
jgi:hypothetical protein